MAHDDTSAAEALAEMCDYNPDRLDRLLADALRGHRTNRDLYARHAIPDDDAGDLHAVRERPDRFDPQ